MFNLVQIDFDNLRIFGIRVGFQQYRVFEPVLLRIARCRWRDYLVQRVCQVACARRLRRLRVYETAVVRVSWA